MVYSINFRYQTGKFVGCNQELSKLTVHFSTGLGRQVLMWLSKDAPLKWLLKWLREKCLLTFRGVLHRAEHPQFASPDNEFHLVHIWGDQ